MRMTVTAPKSATATTVYAKKGVTAGLATASWNKKLNGKPVAKGRYKLTLTATANGKTTTQKLTVKLHDVDIGWGVAQACRDTAAGAGVYC